jgi:hypothetical protein
VPEASAVTGTPPAPPSLTRGGMMLVGVVIAGITLLLYLPGLAAGFVGDDVMILHRLRPLTGPADVLRFFGAEFFEYYRPLGFVAHAIDYAIAGSDARQFHLTNLLLHTVNTILVLLIARRLSPDSLAAPIAALLFALHASNHEAVMWISARFDLLATMFALSATWATIRIRPAPQHPGSAASQLLPAFFFALAVLSKESTVALPIAAAGWMVFCLGATTSATVRGLAPWLAALAIGAAMRSIGGGISATGGAGRLPKLVMFGVLLASIVALPGGRWHRLQAWLLSSRRLMAIVIAAGIAALGALAAFPTGPASRLAAEKLAVAGFALVHLFSPLAEVSESPFYLNPDLPMYWAGGLIALSLAALAGLLLWRPLLRDARFWFLAALTVAALLPISALTEGKRYLYLPSAAISLALGVLVAELRGARFRAATAAVMVVLAVSGVEVGRKIRDWRWAGAMTAEGASLVDEVLKPSCGDGHVVFVTSPVGMRGVYSHFYYETFELPRGCMPAVFQVLIRVVRIDSPIDVRWEGADRIVITAEQYRDNFLLSSDLRKFDRALLRGGSDEFETPIGHVRAEPHGRGGQQITLTVAPPLVDNLPRFFYYSQGRIRELAVPPRPRFARLAL